MNCRVSTHAVGSLNQGMTQCYQTFLVWNTFETKSLQHCISNSFELSNGKQTGQHVFVSWLLIEDYSVLLDVQAF